MSDLTATIPKYDILSTAKMPKMLLTATQARAQVPNALTGARGVSHQRMHQLLSARRVKGAYRIGRQWVIPQPVVVLAVKP
jgi:hypothetical protein